MHATGDLRLKRLVPNVLDVKQGEDSGSPCREVPLGVDPYPVRNGELLGSDVEVPADVQDDHGILEKPDKVLKLVPDHRWLFVYCQADEHPHCPTSLFRYRDQVGSVGSTGG